MLGAGELHMINNTAEHRGGAILVISPSTESKIFAKRVVSFGFSYEDFAQ